jgi:hypothetical protein
MMRMAMLFGVDCISIPERLKQFGQGLRRLKEGGFGHVFLLRRGECLLNISGILSAVSKKPRLAPAGSATVSDEGIDTVYLSTSDSGRGRAVAEGYRANNEDGSHGRLVDVADSDISYGCLFSCPAQEAP